MSDSFKSFLAWLTSIAGIVLAVLVATKAAGLPDGFWEVKTTTHPRIRELALDLILVLTISLQPALAFQALRGDAGRKDARRRKTIEEGCNLLLTLACSTPVNNAIYSTSFGVHCWKVNDNYFRKRSISRIAGFKLYRTPQSGVKWREGVGAIGVSLSSDQNQFFDLTSLNTAGAGGQQVFEALPESDRLGMGYIDWSKTKSYTGIGVWLLRNKSQKVCGILTFDCTNQNANAIVSALLMDPVANTIVSGITSAVAKEE